MTAIWPVLLTARASGSDPNGPLVRITKVTEDGPLASGEVHTKQGTEHISA
jgi:hypothetical protein